MLRPAACLLLCLLCAAGVRDAAAQEARVFTKLYDLRGKDPSPASAPARPEPIGSSQTLFHAGKVYDLIESVGEIIMYEPAQSQFTIINGPRMLITTIPFSEIEDVVHSAQQKAERYLREGEFRPENDEAGGIIMAGATQADADFLRTAGAIRFQLHPAFAEQYDAPSQRLHLMSPHMSYNVKCSKSPSPELLSAYLRYTAWTARLNYLLHPQGLFPGPRLALNKTLVERQLLPVEVELHTLLKTGLHLRAVHKYEMRLSREDRKRIHYWETLRTSQELKALPFDEFQRVPLTDRPPSRR